MSKKKVFKLSKSNKNHKFFKDPFLLKKTFSQNLKDKVLNKLYFKKKHQTKFFNILYIDNSLYK